MFLKLVLFLATIPYLAQSVPCSCSCTSQTTVTTIEYSACSIIQNYYETLTGAWNTWMLTESSFLPTIGGFPHCSWWNYCRKDCGSLTVSINRYESTQSIYLQTFGYYKGRGTLHFEYVSSLTSDKEMIFQNQFQCAKFNGEDNSVQDLTLSEQEISDITRDFSIVYTDESGKGILIIVSKEKINNGAYYIIVLISEDFYVTGKYIEYRETIKSILIEKNIDCSSLVEIELHSLSNDSGSSCGCGTQISTSTSSGSSTEVSIDITEEELSVEIKPIEKIQDYACKVSGKWFIWKSNTDDLYDTTSSVWNPSGCQSIWYTIESEDGKSNKLKWIQHAYNIKKKATFVLEHRVTTMTKKLATYKDEFISAYWEYDDGSCETVTIGDYEKQLYTSYYSIVWVSPDFSVIVYATNFKINGIRHAWVSVREDVISSGSYTQYAEKIIEILKSYSIVTISDFEITCGCSQQISSASSTQVSVEISEEKVSTGCGCGCN